MSFDIRTYLNLFSSSLLASPNPDRNGSTYYATLRSLSAKKHLSSNSLHTLGLGAIDIDNFSSFPGRTSSICLNSLICFMFSLREVGFYFFRVPNFDDVTNEFFKLPNCKFSTDKFSHLYLNEFVEKNFKFHSRSSRLKSRE